MIFHKASEERKWKQWKEQEERILRESGVSESVIQRLRELDWQDFNTERRYWEHFSPNQEELYTKELEEQSPVALTIQQLLDSVENEQLLQILLESDKKTLQILLLKMWGFSIQEIAEQTGLSTEVKVVGGAGDNAAAAVGTGVVRDGSAFTTIGTSGVVFAHSSKVTIDPKGRVHTCCCAVPGAWHVMGVTQGAGYR